ncbi:hypothetical protein BDZ85DRAFT_270372 [Elsinoe ampelina]|uniref:Uncharacterized protein n=1 Tax=Elsinoe ampelina TaxID=302913 RepID=A0A6A6FZ00_9PEZI|nr:hypothetical protein BDZ85DRAFT_270372 [Elsinoe ampelina]
MSNDRIWASKFTNRTTFWNFLGDLVVGYYMVTSGIRLSIVRNNPDSNERTKQTALPLRHLVSISF